MKTINDMPIRARAIVTLMLRRPNLKLSDFEVVVPLYKKVVFSDEEKKVNGISEVNGTYTWPMSGECSKTVELENAEAKKLLQILNEFEGYTVDDVDWVDQLKKILE